EARLSKGLRGKHYLALSRAELGCAGLYEKSRLLCLQIVPARNGVDCSPKWLRAGAEHLPPAPERKSSLHRLLAAGREQPSVEAGRERQHRPEGGGDDGRLEAPGQEGRTRGTGCCVPGDRA